MVICTVDVLHFIVTKNYHKYLVAKNDCNIVPIPAMLWL